MPTTHLYLIRHGQSEANLRDCFLGHGDLPLTALGHQQAQLTAGYLDSIHADAIYASDLRRAYDTAQHTAQRRNMTVTADRRLREINAGEWDFRPFTELVQAYPEAYDLWQHNIGLARCVGGESVVELQSRIVAAVTDLAQRHEGQTIFLFLHATPIRVLRAFCEGLPPEGLQSVPWASNASVSHVVWDGEKLTMAAYSMDHFMGELVTALPDSV